MIRLRRHGIPNEPTDDVAVHEIEGIPGRRVVTLSVDRESVARGPLVRGAGPPFMVAERQGQRVRLERQGDQRQGFLTVAGPPPNHVSRFEAAHPDRRVVAVTGHGNLGLNAGCLAGLGGERLGADGFFDLALHVAPDARAAVATTRWPDAGFVLTGPRLVLDGVAAPPDPRAFPDLRHLLLFPWVEVAAGRRIDFGHDILAADAERLRRAVGGEAVTLPLVATLPADDRVDAALEELPVAASALRAALAVKGYRESAAPTERGSFALRGGALTISFLPGIYPHHVLAVREDGRVASILVTGRSNRAGVRIAELAEDLAAAGVRHALLLDNGGDVAAWLPQERRFLAAPAEADRASVWPTSACLLWHEPAIG